jgi:hypothetical protein
MRNCGTKEKLEFVYAMAKHSDASIHDLQRLMRLGATNGAIAEAHCNGDCPYNQHDYDGTGRDCPKQERIQKKIEALCKSIQCGVVFQGDPRGCTVKLVTRDGYTNDWGREGICVPTS